MGAWRDLYLPEGVAPMLPWSATKQLGLGLAVVSPALSFGLRVTPDGGVADLEITPSWVRVQRLSYGQAEELLDQEPLRTLYAWATAHAAWRSAQGAIALDLPEVRIKVEEGQVAITPLPSLRSQDGPGGRVDVDGRRGRGADGYRARPWPFLSRCRNWGSRWSRRTPYPRCSPAGDACAPAKPALDPAPMPAWGWRPMCVSPARCAAIWILVAHQQIRVLLLAGQPLLDEAALLERVGVAEAVGGAVTASRAACPPALDFRLICNNSNRPGAARG